MKTSGFNFVDLDKENKELGSIFNEGDINIMQEKPKKKKIKWKFDHLFPAPKNNQNMGMGNIYDGEPFENII